MSTSAFSVVDRIRHLEGHVEALITEIASLKLVTGLNMENNYSSQYTHNSNPPETKRSELYVLWDTETNGLGKTQEIRVCQVGAVALDQNMREISSFNEFVNPLVAIDSGATAVNGIDTDFVSKKPGWDVVGRKFNEWIDMHRGDGSVILVGHNTKRFDARILTFEHNRHDLLLPPNLYNTDTIPVFKELFPHLSDYKLGTIYYDTFNEPIPDQHTALADVKAMQRLLDTASPKLIRDKLFKHRESFDTIVKRCFKTK